jgi:hypothetical protein
MSYHKDIMGSKFGKEMPAPSSGGDRDKFWEGPYPAEQAPLGDKKIQKMAEALKQEGCQFELTENSNEYILRVQGFEGITHITKVDDVDIYGIIFDRIKNPEPPRDNSDL